MIIAVERVMGRYNTGRDLSREIEEDRGGGFLSEFNQKDAIKATL
jgi:hypothetical protein